MLSDDIRNESANFLNSGYVRTSLELDKIANKVEKQELLIKEMLSQLIESSEDQKKYQEINKNESGHLSKETGIILHFNKEIIQKAKEVLK